jgi:hypothetical protein
MRGDLRKAESEIRATIEMLARQAPWAEGEAWVALGDNLATLKAARYVRERVGPERIAGPRPRTTTVLPALLWPGSPIWFDAAMKPALEQLIEYTATHTKG